MKVVALILLLAALAKATPLTPPHEEESPESEQTIEDLIELTIAFFRNLLKNGDPQLGVTVLDPILADQTHLILPGSLFAFDLYLTDCNLTGLGDFRVDHLALDLKTLTLEYDIVIPLLSIRAENYKLSGHIYQALPVYGDGLSDSAIVDLRMVGSAQLAQSANGRSLIIQEIGDAVFSLKEFVARSTGYLGGGDIDNVINAVVTDLAADYVTRFSRHISYVTTPHIRDAFNQVLEQLDTWPLLESVRS